MKTLLISILVLSSTIHIAQNRHLDIGAKGHGICFGNSASYNGLRLNVADKNVKRINGINLAILSGAGKMNGLSVGLVATDSVSNGIKIGILGADAGYHNGFVLGGLNVVGRKINGIGLAMWTVSADTLNGLFLGLTSGVTKWSMQDTIRLLNGFAFGGLDVRAKKMQGVSLSVFMNSFNKMNGLSVSLLNKTETLHGFQFGLINYAGNNRPFLKWTPFFNFNFRKTRSAELHG